MMNLDYFQGVVERESKKPLLIKLNNNSSTMFSVRWDRRETAVSLHRMFLNAPANVMDDLACYILKKTKQVGPSVKEFIEKGVKRIRLHLDPQELTSQGFHYNLKVIYNKLNRHYFQGKLNLHITWYGVTRRSRTVRITIGQYCSQKRLIKIHRLLDNPKVPRFVIEFVIYHEMVHHVCPPYVDENGIRRIHNPKFKRKEEQYEHFEEAQEWIKKNQRLFFGRLV